MIKKIVGSKYNYVIIFDTKTGVEICSGINNNPDPITLEFPSLIDIGIMGRCSNKCKFCYQGNKIENNMDLENFKNIIDQCKDFTTSVALGGRGDPNLHENFEDILEYAAKNNVVPNYTTSGINLTDREIALTKEFCGAVAVSAYWEKYTFDAIERFISAGVKTNIHYVLSNISFDLAINILTGKVEWFKRLENINAIIFLLFKPQGNGKNLDTWILSEKQMDIFAEKLFDTKLKYKVGMDSCCVNKIVDKIPEKQKSFLDTCEAARFSMYITPTMYAKPCSFAPDSESTSIAHKNIKEVWDTSLPFLKTRTSLEETPNKCPYGF